MTGRRNELVSSWILTVCQWHRVISGQSESRKKEVLVVGFKERTFGSSDFFAEQTLISASALSQQWELLYNKTAHSSCELWSLKLVSFKISSFFRLVRLYGEKTFIYLFFVAGEFHIHLLCVDIVEKKKKEGKKKKKNLLLQWEYF